MTPAQYPQRNKKARISPYWLYAIPGFIGMLFIIVIPLIGNVYLSFTKWSGVGDPKFIGLDNYTRLFADEVFWKSFENTIYLIAAMVVIPTIIGLILAAVLFDYIAKHFNGKVATFLRATYYIPQILPISVAGILWAWIFSPNTGALNQILRSMGLESMTRNWLGDPSTAMYAVMLVMVWVQIGYPVVIFMAAMSRIDLELYEAADLDGAGWWRRFQAITVPMIRPEIFVISLTCTIAALKSFAPVYTLTQGGPENATNVPSYFAYQNFFTKGNVGYGASISTVLTILILIIAAVMIAYQFKTEKDS